MAQHKHTPMMLDGIMTFLTERHDAPSTAEVGAAVNISVYQARYYLQRLSKLGLVDEIGGGRGVATHWQKSSADMECTQ